MAGINSTTVSVSSCGISKAYDFSRRLLGEIQFRLRGTAIRQRINKTPISTDEGDVVNGVVIKLYGEETKGAIDYRAAV